MQCASVTPCWKKVFRGHTSPQSFCTPSLYDEMTTVWSSQSRFCACTQPYICPSVRVRIWFSKKGGLNLRPSLPPIMHTSSGSARTDGRTDGRTRGLFPFPPLPRSVTFPQPLICPSSLVPVSVSRSTLRPLSNYTRLSLRP